LQYAKNAFKYICKDKSNFPKNTFFYFVFMIIYETGNIAKYSIICMFRKHFEAIVPFSEIIFVLLQAYHLFYNNVWQRKM